MTSLETMQDIGDILQNRVLLVAVAACLLAQFLKLVFELIVHRKINIRVLVETGGMPDFDFKSRAAFISSKEGETPVSLIRS